MSVHTVAHYVVHCNKCDAEHLVGPVGSVLVARIEAGKDGWQFHAVLVRPDGTKLRRNRDLCPTCRVIAAEIVDDPDTPGGTT